MKKKPKNEMPTEHVVSATVESEAALRCGILDGQRVAILQALSGNNVLPMPPYDCRGEDIAFWHRICESTWDNIVSAHEWALLNTGEPNWVDFLSDDERKELPMHEIERTQIRLTPEIITLLDTIFRGAILLHQYPAKDPFIGSELQCFAGIEGTSAHHVCAIAAKRTLTLLYFAVANGGYLPVFGTTSEPPLPGLLSCPNATSELTEMRPVLRKSDPIDRAVILLGALFARTVGLSNRNGPSFALRVARHENDRMKTHLAVENSRVYDNEVDNNPSRMLITKASQKDILEALEQSKERLISIEVANNAGVSVDTARKILAQFVKLRLVDNVPRSGYNITARGKEALKNAVI